MPSSARKKKKHLTTYTTHLLNTRHFRDRVLFTSYLNDPLFIVINELIVQNITFVKENFCHLSFKIGCRYLNNLVSCHNGITDSCQKICFFINDSASTEIYTLSLHDALPI